MDCREPDLLTQDIGDARLSYLSYEGAGETIVMLHATGFLPWLWHPIARSLAPEFRVLAPYFCDHRETNPEKGGLAWMTLAEDMAAFCRHLGLDSPLLVGHSMGATVVALAAAACGLPARGMVLVEPIVLPQAFYAMPVTVENHPLASRALRRTNHWRNAADALSYLRSRPLFRDWDEEMLQLYLRHGMQPAAEGGLQLACSPRQEAGLFLGGHQQDPWPFLPRVTCPVLVVEGENSDTMQYVDLRRALSLLPRVAHRLVPGAGHLIPMEKPGVLAGLLRDFFTAVTKKG